METECFIKVIKIAIIIPNPPETLKNIVTRRVGMKLISVFIAVSVGIFWASIAAMAFPSITVPVFLITCSITFIALGLCLAGSKTPGFEQEQI